MAPEFFTFHINLESFTTLHWCWRPTHWAFRVTQHFVSINTSYVVYCLVSGRVGFAKHSNAWAMVLHCMACLVCAYVSFLYIFGVFVFTAWLWKLPVPLNFDVLLNFVIAFEGLSFTVKKLHIKWPWRQAQISYLFAPLNSSSLLSYTVPNPYFTNKHIFWTMGYLFMYRSCQN